MRRLASLWLAPLALGCGSDGTTTDAILDLDIRIDQAGDGDSAESRGTEMCVDEDGNIYVIWIDDRDDLPAVWLNRSLDAGASWLPGAVKVNRGESSVDEADIACTTEGVFVAWEDDRDGDIKNHNIYFSVSYDKGETFLEEDVRIDDDPDGRAYSKGPELTAVGSNVYLAWFDNASGAYDIYVASSGDAGASFREPVRVDSDAAGAAYSAWPQIAATPSGNVYVAWEDSRSGSSDIYFAVSDNSGSSFQPDVRIDGGDGDGEFGSFNPSLASDGNDVYVVWHDARHGEGRSIMMNYSPDGGFDWKSVAERVDSDQAGFFNSVFPDVEVQQGVAHIVWQDNRDTNYDIYYRSATSGNLGIEEVSPEHDVAPGFSNSQLPQVALGDDRLAIAWTDGRVEAQAGADNGYVDVLYQASTDGGTTFEEEDLRIDVMQAGASYKLDLNVEVYGGLLFAAWTDGRNGSQDVYFNAVEFGEGVVLPETTESGTLPTTGP